jgi:NAD(P)-dependent dehydrogenase (short-subunit alcohol dehydrogenase family)
MDALFDIRGRVVVVTGGAQGLGRMIAEGFVGAGAEVLVTSRQAEVAAAAAQEMNAAGGAGRCTGLAADLSTPEGAAGLVRQIGALVPAVHVLVNNAGRTWGAPFQGFPDKAWPGVMATNVQMPFTLVRDLMPLLRAAARPSDPARVINIGSLAGAAVEPISAFSYAASKAALHHLGRVLAAELGPEGITVNTVVPGYFPTRMTAHIRAKADAEAALVARVPLRRLGRAQDIAGMCIFLASPAGGYITGAELMLDGGMHGCR